MPKLINPNANLIKLIFVTVFSMGLTLVSSFILAHMLSVEDRGSLQLFITTVSYVVTLGAGGVGFALALAMRQKQYRHWQYYFIFFLMLAIVIATFATWVFDFTEYHLLFVLNVLLTAILTITLEKSKIDPKMQIYRVLTFQQPVLMVLIYGGAYYWFGEQSLKTGLLLLSSFSTLQAVACLFYLAKMDRQFRRENAVTPIDKAFFFKTWGKQNLLQIFGATTSSLDKFLIMSLMGSYVLGLYTVCIAFDSLMTKFINMLADYFYSGLLNHQNRIKAVLAVVGIISIGAVVLVPLLAEWVVTFFFSAKYVEVAPVLILFILNAILAGLSWILSQNMLLLGKQLQLFTRQIIAIAVFVGLFYLFKDQQLYGVAYALLGGSCTRLLISILYYFKYPVKLNKTGASESV